MKKHIVIPAALTVCGLLFSTFAFVQSDEGESSKKTVERKVEVKVVGDVDADAVKIEGDKITIKLPDGKTQVIDLTKFKQGEDAHIEVDGDDIDVDVQIQGKAIFVGPEGEVKEYDLEDETIELELPTVGDPRSLLKRFRGQIPQEFEFHALPVSEFMIGIAMGPTSETLQAQLGLKHPGIVVLGVAPDSPAAKADIQKHDVLISAGDAVLSELRRLVEVVDRAGSQEGEMTIKLVRQGKMIEVKVKPVKRPEQQYEQIDELQLPEELNDLEELHGLDRLRDFRFIPQEGELMEIDGEFGRLFKAIEKLEQRILKLEQKDKD